MEKESSRKKRGEKRVKDVQTFQRLDIFQYNRGGDGSNGDSPVTKGNLGLGLRNWTIYYKY